MLENFLTDELPLAIAIGCEPDLLCGAQRLTDSFELGGFVAAFSRAGAIKTFGTKQDGDQRFQAGTTSSGSRRSSRCPSAGRMSP